MNNPYEAISVLFTDKLNNTETNKYNIVTKYCVLVGANDSKIRLSCQLSLFRVDNLPEMRNIKLQLFSDISDTIELQLFKFYAEYLHPHWGRCVPGRMPNLPYGRSAATDEMMCLRLNRAEREERWRKRTNSFANRSQDVSRCLKRRVLKQSRRTAKRCQKGWTVNSLRPCSNCPAHLGAWV